MYSNVIMNPILFALVYLAMDVAWISAMSPPFYKPRIEQIQQGKPMRVKLLPALGAYMLLLVALFAVCIPLSKHYDGRFEPWMIFGLVGLCIYGIYNTTNAAILSDYSTSFMLVDTLWGVVSFSMAGLMYKAMKY